MGGAVGTIEVLDDVTGDEVLELLLCVEIVSVEPVLTVAVEELFCVELETREVVPDAVLDEELLRAEVAVVVRDDVLLEGREAVELLPLKAGVPKTPGVLVVEVDVMLEAMLEERALELSGNDEKLADGVFDASDELELPLDDAVTDVVLGRDGLDELDDTELLEEALGSSFAPRMPFALRAAPRLFFR